MNVVVITFEPRHEKTGFLHMRKQRPDKHQGNHVADQGLCFRYTDSTIPLLSKVEISTSSRTARVVSDLVGNPEDRFSHNEAHLVEVL